MTCDESMQFSGREPMIHYETSHYVTAEWCTKTVLLGKTIRGVGTSIWRL